MDVIYSLSTKKRANAFMWVFVCVCVLWPTTPCLLKGCSRTVQQLLDL